MQDPFTESAVYTKRIQEEHSDEFHGQDLALLVDIYLWRLIRASSLIHSGSEFSYPQRRSL